MMTTIDPDGISVLVAAKEVEAADVIEAADAVFGEEVESSVEAEDVALVGEEAEALVGEEEASNNKIKPNILLLLCRWWVSRFPLGFELDTNKTNTNNLCQETRNNNVGDDSIFLIRATHLFPI